ncbi:hypothetical protein G9H65_02280 [Cytophagaceae bacterium 50A-KIRBA]|uniref:hypothetical protein n=1 Tax=Aquirufa ecclesiirivi TaxID=2715124 RepID=UPI0014072CA4|nr:hypothetical protein [Aquirufa ecclesiirivi]NHC48150.1 hypothetical protein [Aquirufa ecclesiirivi]
MRSLRELNFIIAKFFRSPEISNQLTFSKPVNEYLMREIKKYKSYLEYGSGSSTLYFSTYNNLNIVSIESDSFYAKAVRESVSSNSKAKVIDSETGITGYWGYPILFANNGNKGWKYVNTPWRILGEEYQPDVVLIDGRYRVACAMNILLRAANKFKVTVMIDDYLGREEYIYFEKYCKLSKMVDRMAFFEYNLSLMEAQTIMELKKDLILYLKKAE